MHGPAYHKIMAQRKRAQEQKKHRSTHNLHRQEDNRSVSTAEFSKVSRGDITASSMLGNEKIEASIYEQSFTQLKN